MLNELFLAFVQAATEFLPVSSSGHLALFSNIISSPDLFFITMLHLSSLIAVLIFTRKEIFWVLKFNKDSNRFLIYLIIATIPAAIFGFLFKDLIESTFSSYLFLGVAFIFTGVILLLTKFNFKSSKLNYKNALVIGLFQVLALFPGVSRSGMTISSSIFIGIKKEKAIKFSFLLFIPLVLGAFILEFGEAYFSWTLLFSCLVTFFFSLIFLNLLMKVIIKNKFWMFSFYCFFIGIISLILHFI